MLAQLLACFSALLPAAPRAPPPTMLRNIDRCELLLWSPGALRASPPDQAAALIEEALAQDTLVAVVGPGPATLDGFAALHRFPDAQPSVPALTAIRHGLALAPDGFGGSDGFGAGPPPAQRAPEAAYCVCLLTEPSFCDAAIGAGMRAVALPDSASGYVDEALEGVADAVVDEVGELSVLDLSTPGSYWLNPACPRDSAGNAVDPLTGLLRGGGAAQGCAAGSAAGAPAPAAAPPAAAEQDGADEGALVRAMLADLDSRDG